MRYGTHCEAGVTGCILRRNEKNRREEKTEMTSLEPRGGYVQNEKQAEGKRGAESRERHNVTRGRVRVLRAHSRHAHLFSCKPIVPADDQLSSPAH